MKLIIVHYHLRPGGIRRIIELATPHLVREFARLKPTVTLAVGEAKDKPWLSNFEKLLQGIQFELFVDSSFNYLSEQTQSTGVLTEELREAMGRLLEGEEGDSALVWAHNLGIARNLLLTRELAAACAKRRVPLVAHHHDWWFDNRWLRWPEMHRFGFRTLRSSAKTLFPAQGNVHHLAINHSDAAVLHRHFHRHSGWLPNLTERTRKPDRERLKKARGWLQRQLRDGEAPVWILPCRFLRRKNMAEALLLARWLRPEAWLVTTGGISSADEQKYYNQLSEAARHHHWRFRPGILQGDERHKPSVPELLAVSEAVVLSSIQEGFGLPYLEAAAAQRPLIARRLPNIAPDLRKFGFRFPQYYEEIEVDPSLFDWDEERKRQRKLFGLWKSHLPRSCRSWVGTPHVLAHKARPGPVGFSRLTLEAQLEVLAQPVRHSWELCAPLNPFLEVWKKRAQQKKLLTTSWPAHARQWLSGSAYAKRFSRLIRLNSQPKMAPDVGIAAQEEFIMNKLDAEHLFPLLWAR